MVEYRLNSHSLSDVKHHLVWGRSTGTRRRSNGTSRMSSERIPARTSRLQRRASLKPTLRRELLSGFSHKQATFSRNPKPALKAIGITEPVGWHTLRYTFGTLKKVNGEDVKTIQELLRHANFKVTMDVYTQAVTEVKRTAQSRVAGQIMGEREVPDEEE